MGNFRNDDPFMPWNNPAEDNPFKPWHNPMWQDDPFAPWNSPLGNERDLEEYKERHDIRDDY